jgi:hypothetical protein
MSFVIINCVIRTKTCSARERVFSDSILRVCFLLQNRESSLCVAKLPIQFSVDYQSRDERGVPAVLS